MIRNVGLCRGRSFEKFVYCLERLQWWYTRSFTNRSCMESKDVWIETEWVAHWESLNALALPSLSVTRVPLSQSGLGWMEQSATFLLIPRCLWVSGKSGGRLYHTC